MTNRVEIAWPGGEHVFALGIGELRAVQKVCDAGPLQVLNALRAGAWLVDWPFAVLRHGLVGGGMDAIEAKRLVEALADHYPPAKFVMPAIYVLSAAILGVEDDPVGEEEGELSPPKSGSSAGSTPTGQRQDSVPGTSTP